MTHRKTKGNTARKNEKHLEDCFSGGRYTPCRSYDVIKPLIKQIACDCGVFIPVCSGTKIIKIDQVMEEVWSKNNKVEFFSGHGV